MTKCITYDKISKTTEGSVFLRIKPNEPPIHCRLIGTPVRTVRVYYDKTWVNMSMEDAQKLYEQHPDVFRFPPRPTYAILVIDREDDRVKIMEFPTTVFRAFSTRYDVTKTDLGSKAHGEEWKIKRTGAGKNTIYSAAFINTVPLTDDEVEQVNEFKDDKDLTDYYPASSYEEVLEMFGLED